MRDATASQRNVTRGALAKDLGCSIETIRYYETIGLLREPRRSAAGYRLYDGEDRRRLRFILRARELGFTIDELRSLLALVDGGNYTCREVYALTVGHLDTVRDKIADLRRLERTLVRISDACTGDAVPECPIVDALWAEPAPTSFET